MRAVFFLGMVALLNIYLAQRLRARLSAEGVRGLYVLIVFAVFFVLQTFWPVLDLAFRPETLLPTPWLHDGLVRISFLALGLMSLLFVYTFIADILDLAAKLCIGFSNQKLQNRLVLAFVMIATSINVGIGLYHAGRIEVRDVSTYPRALPASLDGYKIAQISDTHISANLRRDFAEKLVEATNATNPDIIFLTGDWVDGIPERLENDLEPFSRLRAKDGVYYITGNHEYYWNAAQWIEKAKQTGFHVLLNEHRTISRGTDQIVIAGLTDPTAESFPVTPPPDLEQALKGAPDKAFTILLSHQPKIFDEAAKLGVDLQLSGHTHAGQYFPFTLLIHFFQSYTHSFYEKNGSILYVNRGTGFWGPPLRTTPGEITLMTLRSTAEK